MELTLRFYSLDNVTIGKCFQGCSSAENCNTLSLLEREREREQQMNTMNSC
jgi:hypothetical protein